MNAPEDAAGAAGAEDAALPNEKAGFASSVFFASTAGAADGAPNVNGFGSSALAGAAWEVEAEPNEKPGALAAVSGAGSASSPEGAAALSEGLVTDEPLPKANDPVEDAAVVEAPRLASDGIVGKAAKAGDPKDGGAACSSFAVAEPLPNPPSDGVDAAPPNENAGATEDVESAPADRFFEVGCSSSSWLPRLALELTAASLGAPKPPNAGANAPGAVAIGAVA
jgi:hypothetical protein